MWCPACQADVAAELSHDSRHFQCARCSLELGIAKGSLGAALPAATQPSDAERNARDLLAKWNAQNLLSPAAAIRPAVEPAAVSLGSIEPIPIPTRATESMSAVEPLAVERQSRPLRKKRRRDGRRPSIDPVPEIAVRTGLPRGPSWGGTIGQMCAYFGIGLITCGTSVVLWGYFGGPANFAPTGWLITTIGQMFLFLGVVTLISHGLDQTSSDISARMNVLGQRLIRIELLQRRQAAGAPHPRRSKQPERSDDASAQAA